MDNGLVRFSRGVRAVTKAVFSSFSSLTTVNHTNGFWPINWGGWWPVIRESYAGAWQRNEELRVQNVLTYAPVYACVTLIASDIGKLRLKLVMQDSDGIWTETESPAYSPFLRQPNRFQTRIEFYQWWVTSKLIHGNTYVLLERDNRGGEHRGNVVAQYVLDPTRVKVLVAPDGSIFYALVEDNLAGLTEEDVKVAVPASEIIHDKMNPLYHPLCGVSPISACAIAAMLALKIQNDSVNFFANSAQPSGVLSAPGFIKDETARRLKEQWDQNFQGENAGKVAVLGDGLKFDPLRQNARDAQLIEQLNWTGLDVAIAFHMPPYKIGIGNPPNYNTIEGLNQQYYSECLQILVEQIELLQDVGLGLLVRGERQKLGTEFEVDDLLRMDTATRVAAAKDSVSGGGMTFNEARKKYHGLGKVTGGDVVLSQQQNFSLEALAKRDARPDPFATTSPAPDPQPPAPEPTPAKVLDFTAARARILTNAALLAKKYATPIDEAVNG